MPRYAEVAINTHVYDTFIYGIPETLEIRPGHMVRVAFGTAAQPGIVVALHDETPIEEVKLIDERLSPEPVVTPEQIALSQWIAQTTFAPIGPALWLWLPSELIGQSDLLVTLIESDATSADPLQQKIIETLRRRGALRLRQLEASIKNAKEGKIEAAVRGLVRLAIVKTESVLAPPGTRPQKIQTAVLDIHPAAIAGTEPHLGKKSELYLHVLRVLARENRPVDVSWVFAQTGAETRDLKRLAELGFIQLGEKQTWRDSLANREFFPVEPPELTPDQVKVWRQIHDAIQQTQEMTNVPLPENFGFMENESGERAFLLHGVTGSGKTEIYLRAIEATLAQGRQAMLLVPEIALTAQTVRRVAARFPGNVAVVHSRLPAGELYDTWHRARLGLFSVVVGTRSALFTPLPDVGLICIDEEHDHSYKNLAAPHYDTRQVAEELMRRNHGVVILGSATPTIETFHRAQNNHLTYLHLPNRIMGHRVRIEEQAEREGVQSRYVPLASEALTIDLPPVEVVDMRTELKEGNTSIFSRSLTQALTDVLAQRQQAILFLNRRGTSTYVFCRDCGYIALCPRCDTTLTYHQQGGALRCHHCGYEGETPAVCPVCGSGRIKFFGAGTQHIEAEVLKQFPQARIVRWDADTTSRPDMHDAILERFLSHQADIMVGTQMIAKGLDMPLVTLVGAVSADTSLGLPDFRSGEHTFQLLTQVAGRAGRGLLGGRVILQTYRPENYAIQYAASYDFAGFYETELAYRRNMGYPPYRRLAHIIFRHPKAIRARDEAQRAAAILRGKISELSLNATEIIGPAPCFFGRVNEFYRWQVIIRAPDPTVLLRAVEQAQTWYIDLDPLNLL